MSDLKEQLAALQAQVDRLEDERAVTRVLSAYGPLVDSGSADEVAALWTSDGVYDVDERLMTGRTEIETMVRGPRHQGFIAGGCAHVLGPPHVSVSGDDAVAVCYSLMVVHGEEGFVVRRATANHFQLRRESDGWKITTRMSRILDGRPESPQLLASGVTSTNTVVGSASHTPAASDDRTHLLDTLHRLQKAIDARDWDTIRATFTVDATGYGATGVDAILAKMQAHLGGVGPTQHLLGSHRVEVRGDEARTLAYARVYHVGAGPMAGSFFECMGEYDDQWVRMSDGWRLRRRSFEMTIELGDRDVLRP